jgi:hypothetical protein
MRLVDVATDEGTVQAERAWDRLSIRIEPAIAPGQGRRVEFGLRGVPSKHLFNLPYHEEFRSGWGRMRTARLASDLEDITRSLTGRAASARRIDLQASDLAPVPRYTPWEMQHKTYWADDTPPIREEDFHPSTTLAIDLGAPGDLMLGDSCGNVSEAEGGRSRLRGGCRLPLGGFAVCGGRLSAVEGVRRIGRLAVLPAHEEAVRLHLPAIEAGAERARGVWPGLDPLGGAVVLEWPAAFGPFGWAERNWYRFNRERPPESRGKIILLPEETVVSRQPLSVEDAISGIIVTELMNRRQILPREQRLFRRLLEAVIDARMGKARPGGAVMTDAPGRVGWASRPLIELRWWLLGKPAAMMAYIRNRVGSQALMGGFQEFFEAEGSGPGTAKELLERISDRSGVSLDRIYRDFFEGDALPRPTLESVRFRQTAGGWVVSGSLANLGTGETICPVVLRTDVEPVSTEVTVGSEATAAFRFETPYRPRAVYLDPNKRCFRWFNSPPVGMTDVVEYGGRR